MRGSNDLENINGSTVLVDGGSVEGISFIEGRFVLVGPFSRLGMSVEPNEERAVCIYNSGYIKSNNAICITNDVFFGMEFISLIAR